MILIRPEVTEPGYYWHRGNRDLPWELVEIFIHWGRLQVRSMGDDRDTDLPKGHYFKIELPPPPAPQDEKYLCDQTPPE